MCWLVWLNWIALLDIPDETPLNVAQKTDQAQQLISWTKYQSSTSVYPH